MEKEKGSDKEEAPSRFFHEEEDGERRPWTRYLVAKIAVCLVIGVYLMLSAYYIFPHETILDERDVPGNNSLEFEVDKDYLEVYIGSTRPPDDSIMDYELTSLTTGEVVVNGTVDIRYLMAHLADRPAIELEVSEHGHHRLETGVPHDGPDDLYSYYIVQRTVPPVYDMYVGVYSLVVFFTLIAFAFYKPRGGWYRPSDSFWLKEESLTFISILVGIVMIATALTLFIP